MLFKVTVYVAGRPVRQAWVAEPELAALRVSLPRGAYLDWS